MVPTICQNNLVWIGTKSLSYQWCINRRLLNDKETNALQVAILIIRLSTLVSKGRRCLKTPLQKKIILQLTSRPVDVVKEKHWKKFFKYCFYYSLPPYNHTEINLSPFINGGQQKNGSEKDNWHWRKKNQA